MNLLKKDYNTTITDIESEMPSISGLATNSALTAVEKENITLATFSKYRLWWQNKRYWKESSWYDHDKYITSSELNKLTTENITARPAQAKLIAKADFDNKLIKKSMYLLKMNYKSYKHLIPAIFEVKFILKKMILKKN